MKIKRSTRPSLTLSLASIVFAAFIFSFLLSFIAVVILYSVGVISSEMGSNETYIFVLLLVFLVGTGVLFSFLFSKLALRPINKIINKIDDLASGDFASRMDFGEVVSRIPCFRSLSDTFNKLAMELQNTELLRYDFINNFSHEFKTPIVSIAGFAKLLKNGNLSEEQKEQYLDAIEEESMRLSYMATNVLNLTKVENQEILSNVSSFNVSEQIRSCILMLEPKWTKKNLDLQLDFDEINISANEELLKQVWINLIDNAIKFSENEGTIEIVAKKENQSFAFAISNAGTISPENQKKIFNKFYQADESHSTEGNGIGLAIVKKIINLHKGQVFVTNNNKIVTFSVILPVFNTL